MTDTRKEKALVLFDADCRLCTTSANRFRSLLATRDFELLPLQTPWLNDRFGLRTERLLTEMHLILPDGRIFAGVDAYLEIGRHYWWSHPLCYLALLPGVKLLLRYIYSWVARNRYCTNGTCEVTRPNRFADFLPLIVLPLLVLLFTNHMPSWILMWTLAFALYIGCKWLTYREAMVKARPSPWRSIFYLFAWPGMDAKTFLGPTCTAKPPVTEWTIATLKTLFGITLIWFIARMALPAHPLLAGWTGMVGVIFMLHFGFFHLLSLAWRTLGINAPPIMRTPILATSLSDFWSKRWNTAFNELAFRYTYRPFRRATTPAVATLLVFLLSGLIHDLLISFPAHGGYGLPTAYFLLQGLGVLGERTKWGRRIGLGRGFLGWSLTVLVTAGPAFWLFHPTFIRNVILPMLHAIGAT